MRFSLHVIFCLFISTNAFAQKINIAFDRVGIIQFSETIFKNILNEPFITGPDLVDDSRKITINIKDLDSTKIRPLLESTLLKYGITVTKVDGINSLQSKPVHTPTIQQDQSLQPVDTSSFQNSSLPASIVEKSQAPLLFEIYQPLNLPIENIQMLANTLLSTSLKIDNVVLLGGTKESIANAVKIIKIYDQRPREIVAKALIYEITDTKNDGFNFQMAVKALSDKLSIAVATGDILSNFVKFKSNNIDLLVSAIETDSRFKLLTSPILRVADGKMAKLVVGSDVPVLDSVSIDKNGNPIQSVQYRSSGVIFEIKPTISKENIAIQLSQQISNFQQTKTSEIDSPTLIKREITTNIVTNTGELILMGGLDEEKTTNSSSGLSFLPNFMKGYDNNHSKTQILIVLQIIELNA